MRFIVLVVSNYYPSLRIDRRFPSLSGVIGTGLFLGTASGLAEGGPLGLLLAYCLVGSLCYSVMVSLRITFSLAYPNRASILGVAR